MRYINLRFTYLLTYLHYHTLKEPNLSTQVRNGSLAMKTSTTAV